MSIISNKDIKELVSKMDTYEKANYEYSLEWKRIAYKYLNTNNEKAFEEAIRWIGVTGSVKRTISETNLPDFANYIFESRREIYNGTFKLETLKKYSNKAPRSYASKICHILNPKQYPIIYDSKVREALEIKDNIKAFLAKMNDTKLRLGLSRKHLYRYDSAEWAKNKNKVSE